MVHGSKQWCRRKNRVGQAQVSLGPPQVVRDRSRSRGLGSRPSEAEKFLHQLNGKLDSCTCYGTFLGHAPPRTHLPLHPLAGSKLMRTLNG